MRNSRFLPWLAAAVMVVAAACSDDGSSSAGADEDRPAAQDSGADSPDDTAADDDAEPAEPLFAGLDGSVTLLTDTSGGGPRPLLEWEAVADADHYSVYVYAPDGDVYWVWTGHDTSVPVGGAPQIADGAPGPSVTDGMTWAVLAHDADGVPLAVSEQRPIAP